MLAKKLKPVRASSITTEFIILWQYGMSCFSSVFILPFLAFKVYQISKLGKLYNVSSFLVYSIVLSTERTTYENKLISSGNNTDRLSVQISFLLRVTWIVNIIRVTLSIKQVQFLSKMEVKDFWLSSLLNDRA